MLFGELSNELEHVVSFTPGMIKGTSRVANPSEVGSHSNQAVVHASAGNRGHHLIVSRSSLQRMGVQDQRPAFWCAVGPVNHGINGASPSLKHGSLLTTRHINLSITL